MSATKYAAEKALSEMFSDKHRHAPSRKKKLNPWPLVLAIFVAALSLIIFSYMIYYSICHDGFRL